VIEDRGARCDFGCFTWWFTALVVAVGRARRGTLEKPGLPRTATFPRLASSSSLLAMDQTTVVLYVHSLRH
jgi:hypothetical protein